MSEDKATVIANLQEQIGIYDGQLEKMDAADPLYFAAYAAIKLERDEAQKKLDALNAEISAGIEAQTLVSSQFESIMIGNEPVSLRDLTMGEDAYQIVSIWIQQYVGDMAQAHAAIVQSYESQVGKLQEDVAELDNLRRANIDLTDKLADMETRRDAAANELAEAQEEQKRLATDNESLRKQLEANSKPLHSNNNTNAAELLAKWKAERPAIYNKRWENDLSKKFYLAELATTGETIRFGYLEVGKYREVSPAEAETFREQAAEVEEPVQSEPVQDQSLVEPPPAIPSEQDATVQGESTNGAVADEEVTVLQRLERLEAAVFGQRQVA